MQVLLPVVGAVLWFLIGRPRATDAAPVAYSHPVAPDDDPEFLRNLEIRHRNQAEADRLKKLKDELDAKERKPDAGNAEPGGRRRRRRPRTRRRRNARHRRGQVTKSSVAVFPMLRACLIHG